MRPAVEPPLPPSSRRRSRHRRVGDHPDTDLRRRRRQRARDAARPSTTPATASGTSATWPAAPGPTATGAPTRSPTRSACAGRRRRREHPAGDGGADCERTDSTRRRAPCRRAASWSDVPEWDAIAAVREYQVTQDPTALAKARAAFQFVEGSDAYSLGACPEIRYQQPSGRRQPAEDARDRRERGQGRDPPLPGDGRHAVPAVGDRRTTPPSARISSTRRCRSTPSTSSTTGRAAHRCHTASSPP